jgi:hypothetical protein
MLGLRAGYAWAEQLGMRARRVYRRKDAGVAAGRGRNKGRKLSTVAWSSGVRFRAVYVRLRRRRGAFGEMVCARLSSRQVGRNVVCACGKTCSGTRGYFAMARCR